MAELSALQQITARWLAESPAVQEMATRAGMDIAAFAEASAAAVADPAPVRTEATVEERLAPLLASVAERLDGLTATSSRLKGRVAQLEQQKHKMEKSPRV